MPSPGIRKRHRRQVDTETAFAPRVEFSPTVHEAEEGEGEDGAQQNSIEPCEKAKDSLPSGQTSPTKAQDADQVQPTAMNLTNAAATTSTAPEGVADPLERISPIEPESGTTSVSGGDDDGKNRPVQSNQQQQNRATTTPAAATTRPTPIARAETPSVASTASSTDRPRWVTLRLEQEDDMKAQTLKELFSRIGAGVVYAAGFLVIVTLIRGSCSLIRSLCLVPVKLLGMLHRRFASYVMKERVLRAAGADDEGGNASLRQHRTDGVVNTFRRVRTADAAPIHPREIQLIYNAREAKCLPPFEVGEKYLDPLYQRHVATAVGSARPYTPNSYYREVLHSDYDGCTLCVDWMFSRIDPSTNYDAADGKKQSAEKGKPLSQKVLHSLDALLDQIRSGRTTPQPQHQSASSKNEKNRRNGVPGFKGVVGVIPGLASSSHSPYIETVCRYLTENGYHAAVMNARGMGSTPLDQPSIMTGAFTDDIRSIVRKCFNEERLKTQLGIEGPLYLVGFSLGGSMLCKYLGEEGRNPKSRVNTRVKAAVSACSPWDFHESSANMETWEAHVIYQPHLAKGIREYMERHREVCRGIREVDVDHLLSSPKLTSTVQSIDEAIVAPVAGFGSRQEYYTAATPMPYLNDIKMPLLCLTAADDPITGPPPRDARWEAIIAKNSNISYAKTPCGGHLGFLQRFWDETFRKGNFMERAVVAHFENCRARDGLIDPRAE
jgi:predicted alpha/beta-fold hydrolase